MNRWEETRKLCRNTLTLRMPPELDEIFLKEVPEEITEVYPEHAFYDDEHTYALVKMRQAEVSNILDELKKVYEILKVREEGFENLGASSRFYKGIPQAMLCYNTTAGEGKRYNMLVTAIVADQQYLYLFSCPDQDKETWEDVFQKVVDSAVVSKG